MLGQILGAVGEQQLVPVDQGLHTAQVGERRDHGDVDLVEILLRQREAIFCTRAMASKWLKFIFQFPAISGLRDMCGPN